MHHIVFIPAAVFCTTAALAWTVLAILEIKERMETQRRLASLLAAATPAPAPAARPKFRPVVIEGGLQTAPATIYSRLGQTPLRSAGGAPRARFYGG
jgi:hypothetical protein